MPSSQNKTNIRTITIDGPAGAGKSTVAKALAKELDFFYLDTGAMYRALALKAMRSNVNLEDEKGLVQLAKDAEIDFKKTDSGLALFLDGQNVSQQIRTSEVTNNTFYIARVSELRDIVVKAQQDIGSKQNIVIEGRDTGTVVFPHAEIKFFLDANLEMRSQRRARDLEDAGGDVDIADLKEKIQQRDLSDQNRATGPLKQADDAIYIDSTDMTPDETVACMLNHIKNYWETK